MSGFAVITYSSQTNPEDMTSVSSQLHRFGYPLIFVPEGITVSFVVAQPKAKSWRNMFKRLWRK